MHAVTLPRLGQTMEKGIFMEWLVDEGETFSEGDDLYVVETDKSAVEVDATISGRLVRRIAKADDELEVGALLAVAADIDEDFSAEQIEAFLSNYEGPLQSAQESAEDISEPQSVDSSSRKSQSRNSSARATPRAKRLARENNLTLATIQGTGDDGLITEGDVRNCLEAPRTEGAQAGSPESSAKIRSRRSLSRTQRSTARHMTRSWSVPQFTQTMEVEARPLLDRKNANKSEDGEPGLTDLLLDSILSAVKIVPECNATFDGEELTVYETINVGVAVASSHGLRVPVLHDAAKYSLHDRSSRLSRIVNDCRADALDHSGYSNGTITFSNLGMTCVEGGTPLINPPQVCIVFAGATVEKPIVRDGQIVSAPMMHIVSAYDHRIIDGATGAKFMQALRDALAG